MKNVTFYFFEMKYRVLYWMISLILTFLLLYQYQTEMVYLVGRPFFQFQQTFIFTDISEAFSSIFQVSFFISCFLVIPFLLYQLWSFLIPSSYRCERNSLTLWFLLLGSVLFLECIILYTILLPKLCDFLLGFETSYSPLEYAKDAKQPMSSDLSQSSCLLLEISIRFRSYIGLTEKIFYLFFLLLQFPLFVVYLSKKGILDSYKLSQSRKTFFFLSLLLSASLSPPEFSSQISLTFVFFLIYELCLFLGFIVLNKKKQVHKKKSSF